MITIDKNVPIPKPQREGKWRELVSQMGIGDSFEIPLGEGRTWQQDRNKYGGQLSKYGKFTSRNTETGIRFWLVEKRNAKT